MKKRERSSKNSASLTLVAGSAPYSTHHGPIAAQATAGLRESMSPESANTRTREYSRGKSKAKRAKTPLWYGIYLPQLIPLTATRQKRYLNRLAELVGEVSSSISLHDQGLVFEIRSSLNYFGGIDSLHERLRRSIPTQLIKWGLEEQFNYAACPTATGSLLLARSGYNALVYQTENLRSALGRLPIDALELEKEQYRRLHRMGLRTLKDIWRLPGDGLRKRFGSPFVDYLNRALAKAPEPMARYQPPPAFNTSYEFSYAVENTGLLLPVIEELLAELCDFLRRRDLSVSQLQFSLLHEQQEATLFPVNLRQPSRDDKQLLLLVDTHLANLNLIAPVARVGIEVRKFDAFVSQTESLLIAGKAQARNYGGSNLDHFMEQLQARLGSHHVKSISTVNEHCPEYASELEDYNESLQRLRSQGRKRVTQDSRALAATANRRHDTGINSLNDAAINPRPCWLLRTPQQLSSRNGKLYHRRPLTILSGPERIENRWWSGEDVRRDYYVAVDDQGARLWLFREKTGERHWYLHGLFA